MAGDWNDIIEINNDADMKARERLADEMRNAGVVDAIVIWTDEGRAYIDSGDEASYSKASSHFAIAYDGEDKASIDDALLKRYEELFEEERTKLLKDS